jgi:hypothetical protein
MPDEDGADDGEAGAKLLEPPWVRLVRFGALVLWVPPGPVIFIGLASLTRVAGHQNRLSLLNRALNCFGASANSSRQRAQLTCLARKGHHAI